MKKFILTLFLLFSIPGFSQNKNKILEITYVKAYKNFKDKTNSKPRTIKGIEYQLLCNSNEGRFEYIKSMSSDIDKTNKRFIGKGGGNGINYKNLIEKKNVKVVEQDGEKYITSHKFDKYKWKLLKESKKILGYTCFKAVGSYKEYNYFLKKSQIISVIVWYSPTIPIPFGPSGFDGLPGLVLESQRGSFYIIASKIDFNSNKKIKKPIKGIKVDDEDFAKKQYETFIKYRGN